MMLRWVWGCAGPPVHGDHQGVGRGMRSTLRFTVVSMLTLGLLALGTVIVPSASATVGELQVAIVNQPADAGVGDLITADAFDPTGSNNGFVQVHVTQTVLVCDDPDCTTSHEENQDLQGAEVSFNLATGTGLATGTLNVISRFTKADGNATFSPQCTGEGESQVCDNPLSIANANDFTATHYKLIPVAAAPIVITSFAANALEGTQGPASDPFDIWEDGCHGTGCNVNLRSNNETYTAQGNFGLAGSVLTQNLIPTEACPGQRVIFSGKTFFHVTTGTEGDVIFLVEHITREDMKASTNNGQKLVGWCIGLESTAPWNHNGAKYTPQTINGQTFYVAMAPKCPNKKNPSAFAPCIVSQMGDNNGGSFIRGYVLGGDPPRRT